MKVLSFIELDTDAFDDTTSPIDQQTWRFAEPTHYLPADIECIPNITSIRYDAATISLGENLGQRASLTVTFRDHKHVMGSEPFDSGTFWAKFRARYGQKLRGRPIRLIRGVLGQSLADMENRHFFCESSDGPTPDGTYTIVAKDLLKFADDDRSQAPRLSNGRLAGSIDDETDSATLDPEGIGDLEYPASGHICFGGKEIVEFTRSGDTLTITRGQLGSPAMAHTSFDRAQLVLNYDGDDAADIVADLLENYAGVDGDYIPLAEWQAETAAHLGGIIYARAITEPTSVSKLVSELIEDAAIALWWDERAQIVRLQVLKEIATDAAVFDEEVILEGSLKVQDQPGKRVSQVYTWWGQRNPADRGDAEDNYRATHLTVAPGEVEYGSPIIKKVTGKWLATLPSAERHGQIKVSRFQTPPRKVSFDLFHGTPIAPGGGYRLRWRQNQDVTGAIVSEGAPIQVTKVAVEPGVIHVEAEEMLASGVIVLRHTVLLTTTGSVLNWQAPDSWNDADNEICCIGGGGGAEDGAPGDGGFGSKGGGAGGFSRVTNVALAASPMPTIQYRVGAGGPGGFSSSDGGDTWFGAAIFAGATVAAKGGQAGTGRTGGGQGGQASAGIGDTKYSGGDGGDGGVKGGGGGGGGGAAGPHGDGADGGDGSTGNAGSGGGGGGGGADGGTNGSNGSGDQGGNGGKNRFGFGFGNSSNPNGSDGGGGRGANEDAGVTGNGSAEQRWTQTIAPIFAAGPGSGPGGGGEFTDGRNGAPYGGGASGAGGRAGPGGSGAQGIIVISWTVSS